MSTSAVTLDFSKAEPISGAVTLDFSKAQPIATQNAATPPEAPQSTGAHIRDNFLSGIGVTSDEGAKNFFKHPLNTLMDSFKGQGELYEKAKDSYNKGDYKNAVIHGLNYLVPFIGQQTDQAGQQLEQGDISGGVARTLGAAVPVVAGSPEVRAAAGKVAAPLANMADSTAQRMYQSALKPSTTINPAQVKNMVQTGLQNEIPVSEAGATKLSGLIEDLNDKIKTQIQAGSNSGATINKFAVASRLADTAKRFSTQVNPEADLNAVSESGNEFLRNQPAQIPAADAQALKQGTYAQLKGKSYGEMQTATKESQKALARGIKEELNQQFPELASLNAQDSKLYQLDGILEKAVQRQSNHQLIGLSTPAAAAAGGVITGSGVGAMAAAVLKAVIDDPVMKSRLAIALARSGRTMPLPEATARIAAYSNALAASAQPHDGQTNVQ